MHIDFINKSSFTSMLVDNVRYFRCNQFGHRVANYTRSKSHLSRNLYALEIEHDEKCFNYNA